MLARCAQNERWVKASASESESELVMRGEERRGEERRERERWRGEAYVRVTVREAIHERGVGRVVDALHVGRVREIAERRLRPGHALHVSRAE